MAPLTRCRYFCDVKPNVSDALAGGARIAFEDVEHLKFGKRRNRGNNNNDRNNSNGPDLSNRSSPATVTQGAVVFINAIATQQVATSFLGPSTSSSAVTSSSHSSTTSTTSLDTPSGTLASGLTSSLVNSPPSNGVHESLTIGSVVAVIIMGCLFCIAISLVVYVTTRRFGILGTPSWRKFKHESQTLPLSICSFEPAEHRGSFLHRMRSFRPLVSLPNFRIGRSSRPGSAIVSTLPRSPEMHAGTSLGSSGASSYLRDHLDPNSTNTRDGRVFAPSAPGMTPSSRPTHSKQLSNLTTGLSVLDEYSFEHGGNTNMKTLPRSPDWTLSAGTSGTFPRSVHGATE